MIGAEWVQEIFVHPGLGWALLIPAVLYGLQRWLDRSRSRRIAKTLGRRSQVLTAELDPRSRQRRQRVFATALFLGLLSLMEPTWGDRPVQLDRSGADLVICVDVSRSMLARDLPGANAKRSRLSAAQQEIEALARRIRGDRLALVAFAGEARLIAPLTRDTETLVQLSTTLDPSTVSKGGTDLSSAVDTALRAIERGGDPSSRSGILLLTDGEDFGIESARAISGARERGVPLFAVGIGSELGSKITVDVGGREEFLRDRSGEEVISALDLAGLQQIATSTGGDAVRVGAGSGALAKLYEEQVSRAARGRAAEGGASDRESRYQWPLLLAFLLWAFELASSDRRVMRRRRLRRALSRLWNRAGHAQATTAGITSGRAVGSMLVVGALATACDDRGSGAMRAYEEGRFDAAVLGFTDAIELAGDDATAALYDHQARAAIEAGQWRAAETALQMTLVRGGSSWKPRFEFLMGNVAFGRCDQVAAQAKDVESEPFAFDLAIVHAQRALVHWKAAAITRHDWPEARRNIERVLRKLGDLHAARAEAEARREKKKEKTPPEQKPESEPETEEVAMKAQRFDADPELVNRILERLAARDVTKREVRKEARRVGSADVERDW